ncbi:phosphoadenosine phosphosulfate reductase family protein [Sulfurisphaera ohwakuensis]|uniref:phosphoadenosine phosphosulfate reductase family protein n=1 Tax=Sulfurisphaera ohwakuensis TaxID=69656 RepID=UPI0036F2DD89
MELLAAMEEAKKILSGFKEVYVMFSGGRDSLVALHLTHSIYPEKTKALFINTGIATPGLLEYVNDVTREMGIPLTVIGPKYDYFRLVEQKGFPALTRRWCKLYLKLEPLKDFVKDKKDIILVTGVRKDESWMKSKASKLYYNERIGALSYAIIYDFTEQDVEEYIRSHGLKKNPLYDIYGKAYDCWCSAYKSPADFAVLALKNPEFFQKFVEAEAKLRKGGSGLFYNHQRIYLRDIQKDPKAYLEKFERTYKCPLCRTLV